MARATLIEMTGRVFGCLEVIEQSGNTLKGSALWSCRCICGNTCLYEGAVLRRGRTSSCGCLHAARLANVAIVHGQSGTHLYRVWKAFRSRLAAIDRGQRRDKRFTISREFAEFSSFRKWALTNGYAEGKRLIRIDHTGPYGPGNCEWTEISYKSRVNFMAPSEGM